LPSDLLRLTFSYTDDAIQLTGRESLGARPARSDALSGYDGQAGFWVEVRDDSGQVVFRRVMHDPMPGYREVHAPGGQPPAFTAITNRSGAFEVSVPYPGPGSAVVLFDSPRPPVVPIGDVASERARQGGPRLASGAAREVARFALDGPVPPEVTS
jgi:hypothetical protein